MATLDTTAFRRDYSKYLKRIKQLSRKPSAKVSGLVSLTVFTVAFFGMFAILPTFKTIGALQKEIEDVEMVNIKLTQKIRALNKAEELYSQELGSLSLVDQVLPNNPEFERLAWQLEWLALNGGVEITNGSFSEFPVFDTTSQTQELQEILVDLSITGSYLKIKAFVESLRQIDRLINLTDISINSKKLKQGPGVISATIKLEAKFMPVARNLDL